MTDKLIQPMEGEVLENKPSETKPAPQGVFIGTLNIMTQPARDFLTEPLADLYADKYHGKFKRPKHVFAFDMGLVALGAVLAAVSIYFGLIYKPFEAVKAEMAISPKAPIVGGEVVVNLSISNNSNETINDVEALLKLPSQMKFERSSLPFDKKTNTVSLGAIASQSDASVRIVGTLNGAIGQNLKASAGITYANAAGKTVKKGAAANSKIANSSFGAEFDMPEDIVVGQVIAGEIRYYNRGNSPIENAVIIPVWPKNFVLASSKPSMKNNVWNVGTVNKGSEGKISWSGTLGSDGENVEFGVETGIRSNGEILIQSQNAKTVSVTDPQIIVSLNGASAARTGDTLTIEATYKNSGDRTLNEAIFAAVAEPGLAIEKIERVNLGDIKPGATGSVKITAKIDDRLPEAMKNSTDPQTALRANISGKIDNEERVIISSPSWNVKIASSLGLSGAARYWSDGGDQLGRGPLPPAVGKATRYWIFWNIKNTTGAVSGARVTGTLPANASFTGKVSAPYGDAPVYDPATRTITWNAGDVPAWPGVTSPAIGAAFEVSLVPTAEQIGTYPKLLIDQKISAVDAATGIALSATVSDTTAHLTTDPQAATTGTVR